MILRSFSTSKDALLNIKNWFSSKSNCKGVFVNRETTFTNTITLLKGGGCWGEEAICSFISANLNESETS